MDKQKEAIANSRIRQYKDGIINSAVALQVTIYNNRNKEKIEEFGEHFDEHKYRKSIDNFLKNNKIRLFGQTEAESELELKLEVVNVILDEVEVPVYKVMRIWPRSEIEKAWAEKLQEVVKERAENLKKREKELKEKAEKEAKYAARKDNAKIVIKTLGIIIFLMIILFLLSTSPQIFEIIVQIIFGCIGIMIWIGIIYVLTSPIRWLWRIIRRIFKKR